MTVRRFTGTETREVMEVRADNLDEVAQWCGGEVWRFDGEEYLNSVDYPNWTGGECWEDDGSASIGDVIVKLPGGGMFDVPMWLFERDLLPGWTEETT